MKLYKFFLISIGIIFLDQAVKLLVHFNMEMGMAGQFPVFGDWFKIHYTLNPGMAFGIDPRRVFGSEIGEQYGKLFLSLFRILATIGIAFYLRYLYLRKEHWGLLVCVALILGGAVGNVLDGTFYGVFLEGNLEPNAPMAWFHGQVIDMIYVDIWEGHLPEWIPFFGDKYYAFWPIFNIADSSIFVGVTIILIFNRRFFKETKKEKQEEQPVEVSQE